MELNQVRARAREFEQAGEEHSEWLERRGARRGRPLDGDELDGFAPEMQHGDPARRWRELEQTLRARGAWAVEELGRPGSPG